MISCLNIKNVGIIDEISIDFNKGLNILTGETGAGKTLIIDALSIISGGRFSKEMIRTGEKTSYIEACFYLPNYEFSIDDNLIVSREININGKNLCKINGRMVTVSELKECMKNIIDIHGQHDNQTIMDQTKHITYLDHYIGKKILKLKQEYILLYNDYKLKKEKLRCNYGDDLEKRRTLDLLEYQLNEINDANLNLNEEMELENVLKVVKNSEKITQNLNLAYAELYNNTISSLDNVKKSLGKIEDIDGRYLEKLNQVNDAYYNLLDVSSMLSEYVDEVNYSEDELTDIQNRLDIINSLKRKYGNNIEDILKYRDEIVIQINKIVNIDEYNNNLKKEIKELEDKMHIISINMHDIRCEYAKKLDLEIDEQLQDLEMKNAKFNVEVKKEDNYTINGLDRVEFLISTNIGDTFKPLTKIASGGEISRIMLAIKTIISEIENIPVMIFDEIDTGISGTAAKAVSEKISKISKYSQVLCVTHLAVIAAKADYNYYISKKVVDNKTKTHVKLLNEEEVIKEVARIATGETTQIALQHAKSLRMNKDSVTA